MASDKHLSDVLAHLVAAISNCSMYSAEHPAVEEFLGKVLADLENLFVEDSLSLTLPALGALFFGAGSARPKPKTTRRK